jgi:hypothetical protein
MGKPTIVATKPVAAAGSLTALPISEKKLDRETKAVHEMLRTCFFNPRLHSAPLRMLI